MTSRAPGESVDPQSHQRLQRHLRMGRIHEKLSQETKVQDILDRHNQIVQRFEMKLEQLQKLMGEQDIKLLSYSDTLREIRRQCCSP